MRKLLILVAFFIPSVALAQSLEWDLATDLATAQTYTYQQQLDQQAPQTITPACVSNATAPATTCSVPFPETADGLPHAVTIFTSNVGGVASALLTYNDPPAPIPTPPPPPQPLPTFSGFCAIGSSGISKNGSSTIKCNITGGTLANANVEIQVFNSAGQAVGTQVFSKQNFAANTLSFSYTWKPSAQTPPVKTSGVYTVEFGVFDSTWKTNFYWNNKAGTITIQ